MALDKKTREKMRKIDIASSKEDKKERNDIVEKEFSLLAKNIAFLRFRYGETQSALAEAIGVTLQAVSRYEKETQPPSRNELFLIAEHYDISIDALLNYDLSRDFVEMNALVNDVLNRELIYRTLFPIIYNDDSMANVHFKEAFDLHCEIRQRLCQDKDGLDFANINIKKCTRLYQKAAKDGVLAASANLLWWPMIQSVTLAFFNKKIEKIQALKSNEATFKDVLRESLLTSYEELDEDCNEGFKDDIEYIIRSDYLGTIIDNISLLKKTGVSCLCDLADYYIAIAYKYNVMSYGRLSKNQSRIIGEEMLRTFNLMENGFVKDYYFVFRNQDDID